MSAPALALPRSLQPDEIFTVTASREDIADLAFSLWQARGSPEGSADDDWFAAEQWLLGMRKSDSQSATNTPEEVVLIESAAAFEGLAQYLRPDR